MNQASVGFHCPECLKSGRQKVVQGQAAFAGANSQLYVTKAIIGLNVLVFVLTLNTNGGLGLKFSALQDWSTFGPLIDLDGSWWRLITGGFLHSGPIHIGMNMYILWMLGKSVERSLGPVRYASLYMTALLAGSMGALVAAPDAATVGASGAVFGLVGALAIAQRAHGRSMWAGGIGSLLLINLVISLTVPNISIGGHVGGFLGGLAAGWMMYEAPRTTGKKWTDFAGTAGLAVVFLIGGLWAATTWVVPIF